MLHTLVKSNDPAKVNVLVIPDDQNKPCMIERYNRADLQKEGEVEVPRAEGLELAAKYAKDREQEQINAEVARELDPTLIRETKEPLKQDEELLDKLFPYRATERLSLMCKGYADDREGVQEKLIFEARKPHEVVFVSFLAEHERYSMKFSKSGALEQAAEYERELSRKREKEQKKELENQDKDNVNEKSNDKNKSFQQTNPNKITEAEFELTKERMRIKAYDEECKRLAEKERMLEQQAQDWMKNHSIRTALGMSSPLKNIQEQLVHTQYNAKIAGTKRIEYANSAQAMLESKKEMIVENQEQGRIALNNDVKKELQLTLNDPNAKNMAQHAKNGLNKENVNDEVTWVKEQNRKKPKYQKEQEYDNQLSLERPL